MRLTKVMAICFWAVGIIVVLVGIAIEVAMGADMGFVMITSGAVVGMFGGMLFAKLIRGDKG